MKRVLLALLLGTSLGFAAPVAADPPASCGGDPITDFRATDDSDFLTGTADRDVIALGTGWDQYFAAEGGDLVCGNAGNDVLGGEDGPDYLDGGAGGDTIAGLAGGDILLAGSGSDELDGGDGNDVLRASFVDGVRDDLFDGAGIDTLIGNDEDVWHRCADGDTDFHDDFSGTIVGNPDC